MDMQEILNYLNGWLGANTIKLDQLKQLVWAMANDPDLEAKIAAAVKWERDELQAEMDAGDRMLGSSNFEIHDKMFKDLFGKGL